MSDNAVEDSDRVANWWPDRVQIWISLGKSMSTREEIDLLERK